MGTKRNVDMSTSTDKVKIVVNPDEQVAEATATDNAEISESTETATEGDQADQKASKKKESKGRSRKYAIVRSQVDKTKLYDAFAAVELIKKLSYSKFEGTITADAVAREVGVSADLTFPHSTGKSVRAVIVDDAVLAEIEAGVLNFDVLIAEPRFVPKLAKFAKVLGPKGLMPNPKNGTITPKPEVKKKELEGGKITVKTEKKQAVMHIVIGKTSMETKALVENLQTLITAVGFNLVKLSISASMSPSVKVKLG